VGKREGLFFEITDGRITKDFIPGRDLQLFGDAFGREEGFLIQYLDRRFAGIIN
jgi:hypothetical protein